MQLKFSNATKHPYEIILADDKNLKPLNKLISKKEHDYVVKSKSNEQTIITLNRLDSLKIVVLIKQKKSKSDTDEAIRKLGASVQSILNSHKAKQAFIQSTCAANNVSYLFAEGLSLANYQFLNYKSDAKKLTHSLTTLLFSKNSFTATELNQLDILNKAISKARDLVNEPLQTLTATALADAFKTMGKEAGFKVTVLNKEQITNEKMGGILAVNRGSILPPTFSVMEYKPKNAQNKQPIVLVGKGIVYDTGGLSLKPTPASMDRMKSDMSGSAVVSATIYAASLLQLPLHIIALVPATENRPGENAYVPGDVITMYSGKTVEVLNTDAEGRLVLADALHWAKRYEPALVVDFATLTGAAAAAIGDVGIVCMGNAEESTKLALKTAGTNQYERLVEFPMWDEYGDMIKSDIADLKNIGGPYGGAITAGKFLEHFVDYPWMHFDIAGVSLNMSKKGYHTIGGTAYGVRMMMYFLMHYTIQK
jgi:leucyl aminopeptidase